MGEAKAIVVRPIRREDANRIVRTWHYSGAVVKNSQIHLGVFLHGRCGGALQFGPSMDKRKLIGLVRDTRWNDFIELNRFALADWMPRNSESRAIAYAMRWLRQTYPHLQWVVSFADATRCGDGTIYRASNFVLTGIKPNKQILRLPGGKVTTNFKVSKGRDILRARGAARAPAGAVPLRGYQLRYLYFLHPDARHRLTVPALPFAMIDRIGAGMYKGQSRAGSSGSGTAAVQAEGGGAIPTPALSSSGGAL